MFRKRLRNRFPPFDLISELCILRDCGGLRTMEIYRGFRAREDPHPCSVARRIASASIHPVPNDKTNVLGKHHFS